MSLYAFLLLVVYAYTHESTLIRTSLRLYIRVCGAYTYESTLTCTSLCLLIRTSLCLYVRAYVYTYEPSLITNLRLYVRLIANPSSWERSVRVCEGP
jgi:hypothetical protein